MAALQTPSPLSNCVLSVPIRLFSNSVFATYAQSLAMSFPESVIRYLLVVADFDSDDVATSCECAHAAAMSNPMVTIIVRMFMLLQTIRGHDIEPKPLNNQHHFLHGLLPRYRHLWPSMSLALSERS